MAEIKHIQSRQTQVLRFELTTSPRSSLSNPKSDNADDVPRINGIIISWNTFLSRYLFAYGQACLIIRFTHSARSTSGKNTYETRRKNYLYQWQALFVTHDGNSSKRALTYCSSLSLISINIRWRNFDLARCCWRNKYMNTANNIHETLKWKYPKSRKSEELMDRMIFELIQ